MIRRSSFRFRAAAFLLVFFAAGFLLQASREGDARLYLLAAAVPGGILLVLLLPAHFFSLDRPSLSAALALCGLGILAPAAIQPDLALEQGIRCAASLFLLAAGAVLVRSCHPSFPSGVFSAFLGLMMLAFPFFAPESPVSLSEGGLILLFFSVSVFLSMRLRLPALIISLGGMALLLFSGKIDSATACGLVSILLFWAVSGSGLWSLITLILNVGCFAGYLGFSSQPAESAAASVSARLSACPLILPETGEAADPSSLDSLFLLLGEQYGLIILLCAVLLLMLILLRGASLALHTRKAFHSSLALQAILLLGLRALFYLLSLSGLVPFSSGQFPFLSDALPDLLAQFFLLGILSGVSSRNEADLEEDTRLSMLAR